MKPSEESENQREWLVAAGRWLKAAASAVIMLTALGMGVAALSVLSCLWANHHRSDAQMAQHFFRHQAEFETLIAMFQQDSTFRMIQPDIVEDPAASTSGLFGSHPSLSNGRLREYRRLFAVLGLHNGMNRDDLWLDEPRDVLILRATTSLGNTRKGYIYSPSRELPGYSDETTRYHEEPRVYKRLKAHWYIYFQSMT